MNADPRTNPVTARVIFEGVMLMCTNQRREYEVGMIQCPNHEPTINVVESTIGHQPKEYDIVWPAGHDLIFKVNNSETRGVTLFHSAGAVTDFKNVVDLEGPHFHDERLTVETGLLQGRRLAVTDGIAYAHELTDVKFDLLTWEDENDQGTLVKHLGQLADQIGIKIVCRDEPDSGIDIVDHTTGEVIQSLSKRDTAYVITVNNDCRREHDGPPSQPAAVSDPQGETGQPNADASIGTDFRFYYRLLKSKDGRKFDLGINLEDDGPGEEEGEPEEEEEGPPPSPGACEGSYLSQTDTLGLHG